MGLDVYLEAKITEKKTGRCITASAKDGQADEETQ